MSQAERRRLKKVNRQRKKMNKGIEIMMTKKWRRRRRRRRSIE